MISLLVKRNIQKSEIEILNNIKAKDKLILKDNHPCFYGI